MSDCKSGLIDIGVNLAHRRFDGDRDAVIERAVGAGVERMILTGTNVDGSAAVAKLAATDHDRFSATAGVHPHHASDWSEAVARDIERMARQPGAVAVGETGLDFNRDFSPRPAQEAAFGAQLELAAALGLPAFLHQRDAHERFTAILREHRDDLPAVVVHCFTGTRDELGDYLDLDAHIGVTGWICDERRGQALRDCIGAIPAHRLMIETDAPFLLPRDLCPVPKGGRNEPAFLPHIAATVARLRGETVADLARSSLATSRRFFALEPPA